MEIPRRLQGRQEGERPDACADCIQGSRPYRLTRAPGELPAAPTSNPMLPISPTPRVAVLGGGITGLTAAWFLRQAGATPVVFEAGSRAGGTIGAVRTDGWL